MIKKEEFVPFASSVAGEEVHIHHCKGGKNNDRMYIRRNEDGSIMAYCHHCSEHGYARPSVEIFGQDTSTLRRTDGHDKSKLPESTGHVKSTIGDYSRIPSTTEEVEWIFNFPQGTNLEVDSWPGEARFDFGITSDDLIRGQIGVVNKFNHNFYVFPYFLAGNLIQYQLRLCTPDKTASCKYITYNDKSVINDDVGKEVVIDPFVLDISKGLDDTLVITEDFMSALKVSNFADALPLRGIHLGKKQFKHIIGLYDNIIIMLDNDNLDVINSANTMSSRFQLYNRKVRLSTKKLDPKDWYYEDLQSYVKEMKCYFQKS